MSGRPADARLRLRTRLTPRTGRDRVDGFALDAKGGRSGSAAPPVDGCRRDRRVTIAAGETSRIKTVEIAGDPAEMADCMDAPRPIREG